MSNTEHVFVFATDEAGRHENAVAQLAMSRWGAQRSHAKGPCGSSYAIPVRTRDNEKFSKERLMAEAGEFKAFARANPDKHFILSRLGCDDIGFSDAKMAPHFVQCGPNVTEPGRWLRRRDPKHCVIGVVGCLQGDQEASITWALEMISSFSGSPKGYVVSDDAGADEIARRVLEARGAHVTVETIDQNLYGRRAVAIRNRMIALPATHVLIMDNGADAKCAHMRKTAASEGLEVYEMKIAIAGPVGRDPEVARRSLEEIRRVAESGVTSPAKQSGPSPA